MKRRYIAVMGTILMVTLLISVSVFAKTLYSAGVSRQMESGCSEEEACSILAIMALSDENVPALIEQKYQQLGDWEATAEYYGIDLERFYDTVKAQKKEIPDDIYNEMQAAGMTDDECMKFARLTSNAQMDIQTTWEGKKNGKSIDDLIKERTELQNEQLQAASDYAFGGITATDYTEKMKKLSPDMDISEILEFARTEKRAWMNFRKAASGITDEELDAASKAGVTDFFVACQLKDAEKVSASTFSEMLQQVKNGEDVSEVIKYNISTEKIYNKSQTNKDSIE